MGIRFLSHLPQEFDAFFGSQDLEFPGDLFLAVGPVSEFCSQRLRCVFLIFCGHCKTP